LVEQGIENPRVGGSIPSLATTFEGSAAMRALFRARGARQRMPCCTPLPTAFSAARVMRKNFPTASCNAQSRATMQVKSVHRTLHRARHRRSAFHRRITNGNAWKKTSLFSRRGHALLTIVA
jgi:hypothetical protein